RYSKRTSDKRATSRTLGPDIVAWTFGTSPGGSAEPVTFTAAASKVRCTDERVGSAGSATTSPENPSADTSCSCPANLKRPAFPTLMVTRLVEATTRKTRAAAGSGATASTHGNDPSKAPSRSPRPDDREARPKSLAPWATR